MSMSNTTSGGEPTNLSNTSGEVQLKIHKHPNTKKKSE